MRNLKTFLTRRRALSTSSEYTVMSQYALPTELIESIIDEVGDRGDFATLKQCSLVSQAFVYESQKFLFRSVDLDKRLPRKKYYQKFHRLLTASPHLGAHVRELRLGDGGEDDYGSGGDESWITTTKTLPQTLKHLPRVESFSLSFNSDLTSWKMLPADLRNSISTIFRLPSLESVSLEFITAFPPQLLISLGQVRTLRLSCVEVDASGPMSTDKEYLAKYKMRLENLFLRGTSPATIQVLTTALSSARTPSLKKLALTPTFENGFAEAAAELIAKAGEDIHTFEWLPSIHFSATSGPINLALLPKLRNVRFSVSFRKSHGQGPFHEVLRILEALATATPRAPITAIDIDCHCVRVVDRIGAEWRPLDRMLARDAFEGVKEVRVRMSTTTTSAVERCLFMEAFQDLLPNLESRGDTKIILETRSDLAVWCQTGA